MRSIPRQFQIYILVLMPFFGMAQNLANDSIQINKYLKEIDKSKELPRMFTITDAGKVTLISNYIDAKNKIAKDKADAEKVRYDSQPGVRYRNGDKSVIPEIVGILKSKDSVKIQKLFGEMEYDDGYGTENVQHTFEPEIAEPLFAMVNDKMSEERAVQFLGFNHVTGSIPVFEKRLLSGASKDVDRLSYWILQDGPHPQTIDFIVNQYKKDPKYFENQNWTVSNFGVYMEKASEDDKNKILEMGYDYLDKNMPKEAKDAGISDMFSGGEASQDFYQIILKYGKKDKMKPILHKMVTLMNTRANAKKISQAEEDVVLEILFVKESAPERQKMLLLNTMAVSEMFFEGIDKINEIPALSGDKAFVAKVFKMFEYSDVKNQKELFVESFSKLSDADFNKYVDDMSSPSFKSELREIRSIKGKTFEQNNDELIALGLTNKKITEADIAEFKKNDPYFEKDNSMTSVLKVSGISVEFDSEGDDIPVAYDNLLERFSKASKGKFGPVKSYVQANYNKKKEIYDYRFLVACNGKIFVMAPEDQGDYYDLAAFDKLIEALSKEMKLSETFVPITSGDQLACYVFGQPDKVQELIENYKLSYETEAVEE